MAFDLFSDEMCGVEKKDEPNLNAQTNATQSIFDDTEIKTKLAEYENKVKELEEQIAKQNADFEAWKNDTMSTDKKDEVDIIDE